jgi:hypothetical protein
MLVMAWAVLAAVAAAFAACAASAAEGCSPLLKCSSVVRLKTFTLEKQEKKTRKKNRKKAQHTQTQTRATDAQIRFELK